MAEKVVFLFFGVAAQGFSSAKNSANTKGFTGCGKAVVVAFGD
jgi:hypothetical protein